jgi:hypothetical protein
LPASHIPPWTTFAVDGRVLLFALAATVVTALVFGVGPAALISRRSLASSVRDAGTGAISGGSRFNLQMLVVGLEIACTMVALTGAGLLVKTFVDAKQRDLGINQYDVLDVQVVLRTPQYASETARWRFAEGLIERATRIPGLHAVGLRGTSRPAPSLTIDGQCGEPNSQLLRDVEVSPVISGGWHPDDRRPLVHRSRGAKAPPVTILDEPTAKHLSRWTRGGQAHQFSRHLGTVDDDRRRCGCGTGNPLDQRRNTCPFSTGR